MTYYFCKILKGVFLKNSFVIAKFFVGLIFFFFFCITNLKAANQTEIKQILLNAIDYTCYASFRCNNLKIQIQNEFIPFVFYNFAPNDNEYYAKYIRSWGHSGADAVFIKSPAGDFFWREKQGNIVSETVIKTKMPINAFIGLINLKVNLLTLPSNINANYSRTNSTYNGNVCYKVTVKYPINDTTTALLNRTSITDFQKLSEQRKNSWRKNTYSVFELMIGYKNPFVYSYRCYNIHGENVLTVDFGHPEYLALDASFFRIPDVSVRTAKTKKEFKKIAQQRYSSSGNISTKISQFLQATYAFIESLGIFLLQYGSIIMLIVAILAIMLAIAFKIKERNV